MMTGASKRRRPPKPSFGKSRRHQEWPDSFEFLHDPALPITDKQVREIAASLDVRDDSGHVAAVLTAIRRFDGRQRSMPPGDHRARDVETLAAIARAMDGLNANVLARLSHHGGDLGQCEPAQVAAAAREAMGEMQRAHKPKLGRPTQTSLNIVFQELAAIYETATGRRATFSTTSGSGTTPAGQPSGPCFRFMRAAVAPVAELQKLADHALVSRVKRANKDKKALIGR